MAMAKNGWNMDGIPLNGWLTDMCVALLLLLYCCCCCCCCYIYEYIRNCISVLLQVTYVACQDRVASLWVCFRTQNGDHLRNMGKIWGNGDQYHDDDGILTCIHVYTIFSDNLCWAFSLWLPSSCLLSFLWTMTCWWLSHHLGIYANILL